MEQIVDDPIVECAFGWGRIFRLYADELVVQGVPYALTDLISIHPVYRKVLGISSARLELTFGRKTVVLPGIAAVAEVRKIVDYLIEHYPAISTLDVPRSWQRTRDETPSLPSTDPKVCEPESGPLEPFDSGLERLESRAYDILDATLPLFAEREIWQRERQEVLQRRKQRMQALRAARAAKLPCRSPGYLRKQGLPVIPVPLSLAQGEQAYYCAEATLCGERLDQPGRAFHPVRDHGLLILTNLRMIYMGRKCQILLGYQHLLRASRLRNAVAFLADHWQRREIFVLHRPLECVLCLEQLLWRYQQQQLRTSFQQIVTQSAADSLPLEDELRDELESGPKITAVLPTWERLQGREACEGEHSAEREIANVPWQSERVAKGVSQVVGEGWGYDD